MEGVFLEYLRRGKGACQLNWKDSQAELTERDR